LKLEKNVKVLFLPALADIIAKSPTLLPLVLMIKVGLK
jgi:hypothetical protein